ncbi:hypothetical protein GOBAR_AA17033 [Gossypium barbadense]|uniref:Uncharacterized protein n=1 Tax=Gossypium barbadense TaxID=3634 RepID=A0A2P5XJV7_GOSBA|nr:hypothetical protein GOBAR_AA17033 [Gossypium barbadense]
MVLTMVMGVVAVLTRREVFDDLWHRHSSFDSYFFGLTNYNVHVHLSLNWSLAADSLEISWEAIFANGWYGGMLGWKNQHELFPPLLLLKTMYHFIEMGELGWCVLDDEVFEMLV